VLVGAHGCLDALLGIDEERLLVVQREEAGYRVAMMDINTEAKGEASDRVEELNQHS